MIYKIKKDYGRGEIDDNNQFKTLVDARQYVKEQMESDLQMRIKVVYNIYEFFELVETIDPSTLEMAPTQENSQNATGTGQNSSSTPSPLNTNLRPASSRWGSSSDSSSDDDKDKK